MTAEAPTPHRIATISVLTSPLAQPGGGDAGGLNVYVVETARRFAAVGVQVDIFTRAAAPRLPPVVELCDGVLVRHVPAGPAREIDKGALPRVLGEFADGMLRTRGEYDVVHAHHWLSGRVGALVARARGVPLVQSMHSLGLVKNAVLPGGEGSAPMLQIAGENAVIAAADRLVANTAQESDQLIALYGAAPERVHTVHPGVDLTLFRPGSRSQARARLGIPEDAVVLLFAGRVQRLKGPDILMRAAAEVLRADPDLGHRLVVAFVGGPSGDGQADPDQLTKLATDLGLGAHVRVEPPCPHPELADWYRAATLVVVPSRAETFGLVAVEAQACGTPVVAAAVGGLQTAVRGGVSGVLVEGHDPVRYAEVIRELMHNPARLATLRKGALSHAAGFGWGEAVDRLIAVYRAAIAGVRGQP
ncbi:D-inositol-3-phosphate glycosyltransferase [Catenulispora yoronensis]|uniref:D-inositol-3-phosphate glycosyltransferase n=1 Tax=Catenulispora yoronensis TaxID=450799 RepID=A0ABN2TMJ5_9ACTN